MASLLNIEGDAAGLICAFRLQPFERCELTSVSSPDSPCWLHFNLSDSRARRWLDEHPLLPEDAKDVLLAATTRVHAQVLPRGDGFVAVLGDLHHDFDSDPEGFGQLRVFVGKQLVITARRHPLLSVDRLRRELDRGDLLEHGSSIELFERLVEALADTFADTVARLSDHVDTAEDAILGGTLGNHGTQLGSERRLLARLRRHVNANRAALLPLPGRLAEFCDVEERRQLREVMDRLDAAHQDLELVQERARLLQEEIAARLGEVSNRNISVLSVVTAALLPITMITGIFGMNVGGLPWLDHPHGFLHVVVLMLVMVCGALVYLARNNLFRR